jgi:SSS family solute:Na+ symporter
MVAAMLAAFMSTLDTHLNWGTSYLINDLYQPFVAKMREPHHYVTASRICMLLLTLLALLVSTKLTSIIGAYKYLGLIFGGIGTVMIARWYWWRVNAWSEISALIASLVIGNVMAFWLPNVEGAEPKDYYTVRLIITIVATAAIWVTVTLLTSKKPANQCTAFYRKMQIAGPGWARISRETGIQPIRGELLNSTLAWLLCTLFLFGLLLGIGKLLFHQWLAGAVWLLLAAVAGWGLSSRMKKVSFMG